MSAELPPDKVLNELLKPTGFNCPTMMREKTLTDIGLPNPANVLIISIVKETGKSTSLRFEQKGKSYIRVYLADNAKLIDLYTYKDNGDGTVSIIGKLAQAGSTYTSKKTGSGSYTITISMREIPHAGYPGAPDTEVIADTTVWGFGPSCYLVALIGEKV